MCVSLSPYFTCVWKWRDGGEEEEEGKHFVIPRLAPFSSFFKYNISHSMCDSVVGKHLWPAFCLLGGVKRSGKDSNESLWQILFTLLSLSLSFLLILLVWNSLINFDSCAHSLLCNMLSPKSPFAGLNQRSTHFHYASRYETKSFRAFHSSDVFSHRKKEQACLPSLSSFLR